MTERQRIFRTTSLIGPFKGRHIFGLAAQFNCALPMRGRDSVALLSEWRDHGLPQGLTSRVTSYEMIGAKRSSALNIKTSSSVLWK